MSTIGGLTGGAAAAGVVGATRRNKYEGPLYYTDWTCLYERDAKKEAQSNHPVESFHTREELASERYRTGYLALSEENQRKIDREFVEQYSGKEDEQTQSPELDLRKFKPGQTGSLEFRTHILEHPLVLKLRARGYEKQSWMNHVRATLRYTPCPDDCEETIADGSLCDVLETLEDGVDLDGNRSHGSRGDFEPKTTHGFELEWEIPKSCTLPDDRKRIKLDFDAKPRPANGEPTTRRFTVHAIDVEITYNSFGTNNPEGAMYVLEENLEAVREAEGVNPGTSGVDTSVIEPLVLRANEGDTVEIEFVNSLGQHPERDDFEERPASIHPTGISYEVDDADGMAVGFNENTVVEPGESTTYTWHADSQGAYFFQDGAYQAWDSIPDDGNNEEINSMARGLFGAFVVEPPGATWTDPCTGAPLRSGVRADIHVPDMPDHREFVPIYHDHGRIRPEGLTVPGTDIEQTLHAINYRAERTSERIGEMDGPDGSFYSSWVHGDPGGGDNVWEAYQGDPVKFVIVGANPEENHVHHLHEHRWNQIPFREDSDTLDAQNLAMGEGYRQFLTVAAGSRSLRPDLTAEEAFEAGAGGLHGSIGDFLFHCHMFPHYGEGMNGFMRVHNQRQLHLQPLANNEPDLPIDSDILGFPDFIPGTEGEMPPKPPLSQPNDPRQPEPEEEAALPALVPGAPYTDPCVPEDVEPANAGVNPNSDNPTTTEPDLVYDVVVLPTRLVYNDHGDYDPEGKVYVLEENVDAVLEGEMMPEPLFIRANVGDCIELNVRNELDTGASIHTHFVSYDVLGSDGFANGYNYDQGADAGDTMTYRWFADEEGTIYFHDHVTGISDSQHGEIGALLVEPEGSEWLDPHTGEPIRSGSQAIIDPPEEEAYREFCLAYQDFAPLIDSDLELDEQPDDPEDDAFVNPHEQHGVNAGVGAINYRNAPYYRRGADPDPAYVHSSFVHGDPETPTLEAYPDDKVRIRLVHAVYEEQHNFDIHGIHLDDFGVDPGPNEAQITAPSEAFTFELRESDTMGYDLQPNAAELPFRDYLYGSMISHDLWDGMWGLFRVFDAAVDHLYPVPDTEPPEGEISEEELLEIGHPAPLDRRSERGHVAKHTFDEPTTSPTAPPDCDRRLENVDGSPPPQAPTPGDPCPDDTQTRSYDVTAFRTRIDFNEYGDHDPCGIVYALDDHVDAIESGDRPTEPLLLRANEDDCIELTLTNGLSEDRNIHDDHPRMRTPVGDLPPEWEPSNRISLHPKQVSYDVNGSDGATVGFNYDQTIGPGESITYRWFADEEVGTTTLWDMADMRSNRHHGAFGQLIVEPEGAEWLDPSGEPTITSREAIIRDPDGEDFREFALSMSDARYVVNDDGSCVVPRNPDDDDQDPDADCNQLGDAEDQGYMAFNNRSEPFHRRFEANDSRQERVYDSTIHGDPATPVFTANPGDPVRFRLSQTADASRGISFHLANHRWERFEDTPESPLISVDGQYSPGRSSTLELIGGAGGPLGDTGDFIFKEMKERRRLESGAWGILRVGRPARKKDGIKKGKD
ncbi:multicopper oxidase domain-containing protein [Natronococcus roseus]|uniref:multicopper oxidase domain-containing protein n=1 Tax=Natronococcus roseus TaxID=1052014 RepID=UPI00374CFD53